MKWAISLVTVLLLIAAGLYIILYVISARALERFTTAEQTIFTSLQHTHKPAKIDFVPDEAAESKTYKYKYGHGIFIVRFTAKKEDADFMASTDDSLKKINQSFLNSYLPVMSHRDGYDSMRFVYITEYPHHRGHNMVDTNHYTFTRTYSYYIRRR